MTIILTQKLDYESLNDCLDEYIKKDKLDIHNQWKCDQCNEKICPYQKTIFWNLSPILIFQIKQYTEYQKINKHIEFPIHLNMNDYCINSNEKNLNYKLYGTCNQIGSLNGGHYYANCFNFHDNQWYNYNDSNISLISENEILDKNPYCLFYIREN